MAFIRSASERSRSGMMKVRSSRMRKPAAAGGALEGEKD